MTPDCCWLQPSPASSDPAESNRVEGGLRWGCCTEELESELCGTFGWSLLAGDRGISNDILALALSAMTNTSSKMTAGRSANL